MVGNMARGLVRRLPLMAAASVLLTGTAQAHFKLLKPASWVMEDDVGGPQKGGPCGPGGADDVKPVPMTMGVTTVHAGETIMVEFEETIHHPGWFRIALAEDRSTFKDPMFPNPSDCRVDMKTVPTTPHDNVLVDGMGMDSNISGSNRKFMQMVKIPDKPCDKCTLQVIQVMADQLHSPPGCIYYHCADIKVLPAAGGAAGSSAAAGAGGTPASAGGAGVKSVAGSSGTPAPTTTSATSGAGGSAAVAGSSAPVATPAASAPVATPAAGVTGTTTATGGTGVATNTVTTAGSSASAPTTTPSAPPAQSSSCAVLTPGREHSAAALIYLMGVSLVVARMRRRSSR